MVSGLASKLRRAKYILLRLRESPTRFLLQKATIELRKKAHRGRVVKASRVGERFDDSFGLDLMERRRFGAALRMDIVREVQRLGLQEQQLVQLLAEDFDAGQWPCLGFGNYELRPGSWSLDDFHGFTWPHSYFADINYVMAEERCDTKVPWEKSRMQWLTCAALSCCLDADSSRSEERIRKAMALLEDWVAENPYGMGINWVSSMEVAIRAVNLLISFSLIEDRLSDEVAGGILRSAGEHLHYLQRFPETSDVEGNHYLATALGEYLLQEFRGAQDESPARTFLEACLEQFSAEGLHIEFSPTYHRLSLDMAVIGLALMKRLRPSVAEELESFLKRCVETCHTLANHGGDLPVLSDNDSGMVLNFQQSARRFGAYDWLIPVKGSRRAKMHEGATCSESIFGAVLAGLAGGGPPSSSFNEDQGTNASEGGEPFPSADALRPQLTSIPPFEVMDDGVSKVVVRAGALGLAGRASHDHDDALSFWYSHGGQDFIVEAGCPPYTRDMKERRYSIASTSHNLLTALGEERFAGATGSVTLTLRGGHEGRASAREVDGVPELHTELVPGPAVPSNANPVRHRRTFRFTTDGVLCIDDRASLVGVPTYQLRYHLAPGIDAKSIRMAGNAVVARQGNRELHLEWSGNGIEGIHTEAYSCHLDYGASRQATCIVVSGSASESVEVRTSISVRQSGRLDAC